MSEDNKLLEQAVAEAMATPEPTQEENTQKPYLFETVGPTMGRKNFFRTGVKKKPDNTPKMVDGTVVDLHKPRTVINRFTKKPEIVGVPIAVKGIDMFDKTYHNGVLMTKAERDKLSWEEIEASNKVIKN